MRSRKTLALVLAVVGAGLLFFSHYIAEQLTEGQMKVHRAQGQVNQIDSLFSQSKYSQPIGKAITGSAQKKIDAGQAEINRYESLPTFLQISGIALIGIAIYLFTKR